MKTEKKEIAWFLALNFLVTNAVGFWELLTRSDLGGSLMQFTMLIPALSVFFVYRFISGKPLFRNSDLGFRFCNWKYWWQAPLIMVCIVILSYLISWIINPSIAIPGNVIAAKLLKHGFYWGGIITGLIAVFLINVGIGTVLNLPIFLGEEIGWRGFLYPRLRLFFSPPLTFIIGGMIWGLWHMVMIAQGLNYPGHWFTGTLMMMLLTIPMGFICYYFFIKSNSVFVAGLAHGAVNTTAGVMGLLFDQEHINPFIYGPTGITGITLFMIVAVILYFKMKEPISAPEDSNYDQK